VATQTLASADAILKDLYVGPIIKNLNYKTYLLDQVKRDSDSLDHTGRRAIWPLQRNRNRGRGSRGDAGVLPVAGREEDVDAIIPIRYHYWAIEVSDAAIEASRNNEGAFVKILERETKAVPQNAKKDLQHQLWSPGGGVKAMVTGAEAIGQTVISVDSIQYLNIGDPVDILKVSDGTVGVVGATITNRDATPGAQTITIAPAMTGAGDATFGVYLAGSRNMEIDTIRALSATTGNVFHGINRASAGNAIFDPKVIPLATAPATALATEDPFERLMDSVGSTGQGEVEVIVTSRGIRRRLANTYQSAKRFNDARAVQVHGGYTAIMVNEIPVIFDDDATKGVAIAFDRDAYRWFEQAAPKWLEQDGQVLHLKDSTAPGTKDAVWQGWFKWYSNFACIAPNRTGALTQCQDDAPGAAGE
jgi:hypothetical protein